MSRKAHPKPVWWKNTFFWISGLLVVVALVGIVGGEKVIRDPGQANEANLAWYYFAGAGLMLVNGVLTHRQALRHFEEEQPEKE